MACIGVACKYYSPETFSCDYILHTGHMRGCRVEDCDKHKTLNPSEKLELFVKIRKLYDAGLSDKQIAKATGVSKYRVCMWRRKLKLKMNRREENDSK